MINRDSEELIKGVGNFVRWKKGQPVCIKSDDDDRSKEGEK